MEDQQQVIFDEMTETEALETQRETELTAFFKYNAESNMDPASLPKYVDFPKSYVYAKKAWKPRKRGADGTIGRVHAVNPVAGDVYYLRILLHDNHCKGKKSFKDMMTLSNGRQCDTYKEVCCELGLLNDDREWHRALEEAALTNMCPQIRQLFVTILIWCMPSEPAKLFEDFWDSWVDDFQYKADRRGIQLTPVQLRTMLLLDIELRLSSFEKKLIDFNLAAPTQEEMDDVEQIIDTQPAIIREELDFDFNELRVRVEERVPTFTSEQRHVYELILNAVQNKEQICCFIDARGGCGKTYLINTILAAVRSLKPGNTALAMATTGIAANLLDLGRTFHSRMKAPLTPAEDSTLAISAQSNLAQLIRISELLLIDEATMLDRYMLEAMDRTLRDLMKEPNRPFGGKIVILAGDFRQCLPVVPRASRPEIIKHCINQSALWQYFMLLKLSTNMRVHASGDPELELFDNWTLSIGNGEMDAIQVPEEMIATEIIPSSKDDSMSEGKAMLDFCGKIFPNIEENIVDRSWLEGRAILTSTNKEVSMINDLISDMIPGTNEVFRSADELESTEDLLRFNTEYLNSLNPNGFPPHVLNLKSGMPLLLLRNINPKEGLCNGTKLIFEKALDNKVLQCTVAGTDRMVLIPRIVFIPKVSQRISLFQLGRFF